MRFNRALQMRFVRTNQAATPEERPTEAFHVKAIIIANEVKKAAKGVALAGAGYIILDTFRQVMVEKAKNPRI